MSKLNVSVLKFGYWDDEREEIIPLITQEDARRAAEYLGCSEELIDALRMAIGNIAQAVSEDLWNIQARLDKAGIP